MISLLLNIDCCLVVEVVVPIYFIVSDDLCGVFVFVFVAVNRCKTFCKRIAKEMSTLQHNNKIAIKNHICIVLCFLVNNSDSDSGSGSGSVKNNRVSE